MFPDVHDSCHPNGYSTWTDDDFKHVDNLLIEFFLSGRKPRDFHTVKSYESYLRSLRS